MEDPAWQTFFPDRDTAKLGSLSVSAANPDWKTVDGVLYTKDGKTLVWYPQAKPGSSFSIPSGVTAIGEDAFRNCDNLTSVTVPEGVTEIGRTAFWFCSKLASISLPNTLRRIGGQALDTTAITTITIPKNVEAIGADSGWGGFQLSQCRNLTTVNVASGNAVFKSVNGVLFSADGETLLFYPPAKAGASYSVPNGVRYVHYEAFERVANLNSLSLPASFESFGHWSTDGYWDEELDVWVEYPVWQESPMRKPDNLSSIRIR